MAVKPKDDNKKSSVVKHEKKTVVEKSKTKTKSPDSDEKIESGGSVEPISYRLITYDVWGNKEDGFWIYQSLRTENLIDFNTGSNQEELIKILKEKGILTEKATKQNIKIEGEDGMNLFFIDLEKNMPLFELQNIHQYEKKSNVSEVVASELLKNDFFKTSSPVNSGSSDVLENGGAVAVLDNNIQTNEVIEGNRAETNNLPDYDTSQESIVKQHMNEKEIYKGHLEQILQRPLKYEEVVGTIILRKSFLRPYYKMIN